MKDKEFLTAILKKHHSAYTAGHTKQKDKDVFKSIEEFMSATKSLQEDKTSDAIPFVDMLAQSILAKHKAVTELDAPITSQLLSDIQYFQDKKSLLKPAQKNPQKPKENKEGMDAFEISSFTASSTQLMAFQMLDSAPDLKADDLAKLRFLSTHKDLNDGDLFLTLWRSNMTHVSFQEKFSQLLETLYARLMGPFLPSSIAKLLGARIDANKKINFYDSSDKKHTLRCYNALMIAILFNKENETGELLQSNPQFSLDDECIFNRTHFLPLLHLATKNENEVIVEKLLSHIGHNYQPHSKYALNALKNAVFRKNFNITQMLLNTGTKANSDIRKLAALCVNFKLFELIIQHSDNPSDSIEQAMFAAIEKNDEACVKQFAQFRNHALVNLKTSHPDYTKKGEISPVLFAAKCGQLNLVNILLDNGAHLDPAEMAQLATNIQEVILTGRLQQYLDDLQQRLVKTQLGLGRELIEIYINITQKLKQAIFEKKQADFLDSGTEELLQPRLMECYKMGLLLYPKQAEEKIDNRNASNSLKI